MTRPDRTFRCYDPRTALLRVQVTRNLNCWWREPGGPAPRSVYVPVGRGDPRGSRRAPLHAAIRAALLDAGGAATTRFITQWVNTHVPAVAPVTEYTVRDTASIMRASEELEPRVATDWYELAIPRPWRSPRRVHTHAWTAV